jgi:hypothetical protein
MGLVVSMSMREIAPNVFGADRHLTDLGAPIPKIASTDMDKVRVVYGVDQVPEGAVVPIVQIEYTFIRIKDYGDYFNKRAAS